jgi:hypothetical protein
MKTYVIRVDREEFLHCYVEAESSEQAIEAYYNNDYELHWDDSETKSVVAEEVT